MIDNHTEQNRVAWNSVAHMFVDGSALPFWGPFGIGDDLGLLSNIEGKTFLELGCGSGRSIKYLTDRGAHRVYGLDISDTQIQEATAYNKTAIQEGRAELFRCAMEDGWNIEPVDYVFSVYGFGWTQHPEAALTNVYAHLKPGGEFIWSWDHAFFKDVHYENGAYVVRRSYHDESSIETQNWKKDGCTVHVVYRKTDSWFRLMREAGFEVVGYHEPQPKSLYRAHAEPEKYYSIQKASMVPASFIFVGRKPLV